MSLITLRSLIGHESREKQTSSWLRMYAEEIRVLVKKENSNVFLNAESTDQVKNGKP